MNDPCGQNETSECPVINGFEHQLTTDRRLQSVLVVVTSLMFVVTAGSMALVGSRLRTTPNDVFRQVQKNQVEFRSEVSELRQQIRHLEQSIRDIRHDGE